MGFSPGRSGMRSSPVPEALHSDAYGRRVDRYSSEGISGVVNELLIQMQSFDTPTGGHKFAGWWIDSLNRFLPAHRRIGQLDRRPEFGPAGSGVAARALWCGGECRTIRP